MNTERVIKQGADHLTHFYNGKEYRVGIPLIPKSELESFEKASAYLHGSFMIDPNKFVPGVNRFLEQRNCSKIKELPPEEKERRRLIRNEALDSLLKIAIDIIRYKDHITKDPAGLRYVANYFMHHTSDKEADLKYNQRITDLITRAQNKEFSDDKVLDEQTKKDKKELLDHFRNHLKIVENFDLEEFTSKEWTDEELAKHAGEIYIINSILTNYDDVPKNLFNNFGIKDSECEKTIQNYRRYWAYFQTLDSRVACITSMSYDIYEPENEPDCIKLLQDSDDFSPDAKFADGLECYRTYRTGLPQYVNDVLTEMFSGLGLLPEDISVITPETPKDDAQKEDVLKDDAPEKDAQKAVQLDFYSSADAANKDGEVTFFCEKANIRLTVNVFSDELPKAKAQNKLSELIAKSIVKDPERVEKPNEVRKPKKVGLLGQFADWITSRFTGHKPRQEAYERSMTEYNNYQTELGKYNNYVKEHKKFLDRENENETKTRLFNVLKEKETAIDEAFQKYKSDSELKLQSGILDQIDAFKPQIKNDAKVKDLMQKELSGSYQPQIEENKPELLINIPEKEKTIDIPEKEMLNM